MKQLHFSVLAGVALAAAFLPSAFGNHRTGTLALPELIASGDFNEDGNLDLAANVTGFDNVAILTGDGQGHFTLKGHVATDTLPKGLAVGDLNRDRHLDLVNCNNWGYNAILHLGDGLGGFGDRDAEVKGEGGPNRVVLADFNRDRALDMAVAGPDEGVVLLYTGDGKGGFLQPPEELEDISHCFDVISTDFNKDGFPDLAVTTFKIIGSGGAHVDVFLGDGTGEFTMSAGLLTNDKVQSVAAGDLNNDGKQDLIAAGAGPENTTGDFVTTFLGNGAGNFTLKQTILLGDGAIKGELAVGDFNEDGNLDLAYPQASGGIRHVPSMNVFIFFGDGTGNLTRQPDLITGAEPHTVLAADWNKDGHVDLSVSNRTDGTVSTFLGNGSGTFTLSQTVSVVCAGGVCD